MKDIGKIIWHMEKEDLSIPMGMYMRAIGKMIKPVEKEAIAMPMEQSMLDNGLRISRKDKGWKYGQMGQSMKELMNKVWFILHRIYI